MTASLHDRMTSSPDGRMTQSNSRLPQTVPHFCSDLPSISKAPASTASTAPRAPLALLAPPGQHPPLRPALRWAAVASACAASLLAACNSTEGLLSGDKVDYRTAGASTKPLDVPPDLSQLARESRYQPQGGVVSAAAATTAGGTGAAQSPAAGATPLASGAAAPATVALTQSGEVRIQRAGQQRWLAVKQTPEQLWPQLRSFWEKNGFTLALDNAPAGLMETNWSQNRAKLPADVFRNSIGRLLGTLYDTGERDLFRTRVERTPEGSEIYLSHRGVEEAMQGAQRDTLSARLRPSDPELEAEMLARLMLALGAVTSPGTAAVAATGSAAAGAGAAVSAAAAAVRMPAPDPSARARALVAAGQTEMEVDEPFDRAWRRVGLALDRGGFTVEDRDRASGLYYVRYVDPKTAGQEEPGFFARLFGTAGKDSFAPVRYRIALKGAAVKTSVSVQTSAGAADTSENAKRIVAQLINELK
jgi:outer membrane protein assembly factor BamC